MNLVIIDYGSGNLRSVQNAFNKNILDLTQKDAFKYILQRNNNSIGAVENFLKKNNLSKSVVISNIQIEIIKKYLIGQMFEKEYDDYLKEIQNLIFSLFLLLANTLKSGWCAGVYKTRKNRKSLKMC